MNDGNLKWSIREAFSAKKDEDIYVLIDNGQK